MSLTSAPLRLFNAHSASFRECRYILIIQPTTFSLRKSRNWNIRISHVGSLFADQKQVSSQWPGVKTKPIQLPKKNPAFAALCSDAISLIYNKFQALVYKLIFDFDYGIDILWSSCDFLWVLVLLRERHRWGRSIFTCDESPTTSCI